MPFVPHVTKEGVGLYPIPNVPAMFLDPLLQGTSSHADVLAGAFLTRDGVDPYSSGNITGTGVD